MVPSTKANHGTVRCRAWPRRGLASAATHEHTLFIVSSNTHRPPICQPSRSRRASSLHPVPTRLLLNLAAVWFSAGTAAPAWGQDLHCEAPTISIDIRARTVDGVALDMRGDSLARRLGRERVSRTVEYLEGHASPLYAVDICGHRLARHWNGLSWQDSVFKTGEGVGVGMPLAAFDTAYEVGKAMWSEAGIVVAYRYDDWELFATIDQACTTESEAGEPVAKPRNCIVREVWIPLQTMPE
jgi:hypothetical protein